MPSSLFARKPLQELLAELHGEDRLRRVLGPVQLTALGVGAIIGAGIFVTTGAIAKEVAGPALMLSYVVAGLACVFAALCYSELASMVPVAGSAYTYSYVTLGELLAWIIGWDLVLEYAVGNVTVAIGWSDYFQSLLQSFHLHWPTWLGIDFRSAIQASHDVANAAVQGKEAASLGDAVVRANDAFTNAPRIFGFPVIINLPVILIVGLVTWVLVRGIRESAGFNSAMVLLKLGII